MTAGTQWPDRRTPVLLTAHAGDLTAGDARAVLDYLGSRHPGVPEIAAHLLRTRRIRGHRTVIRAADEHELTAALTAVAAGDEHPLVARSATVSAPRVAFVCPGQGSQWPGMGAEAYRSLPAYRAAADSCAEAFVDAGVVPPLRYLTEGETPSAEFTEIEVQGAQFVHSVALAAVWRSCGIAPDLTVGHSLGEIAAAYIAGSITLADAVAVVAARAAMVNRLDGDYAVAALGVSADAARELIENTPGWIELSVINAPSTVAVAGERDAVAAAVGRVQRDGGFAREIAVNFPVHTSVLDGLREELVDRLPAAEFADTPVQFIGAATGEVVPAGTGFADYWFGNLRNLVRFDRAVATAIHCGATIFIELSAHPLLLFALGQLIDDAGTNGAVLVGSGHRGEPVLDQLSASVAAAAVADPGYRWTDLIAPGRSKPLRDFPNAPMRPLHLWAEPEPLPTAPPVTIASESWTVHALPVGVNTPQRVAVCALDGEDELTERLRAAIEGRDGLTAVPAAEADVVVVVAPALEDPDPVRAVGEIGRLAGTGLFAYPGAIGPNCRALWLVTAGGEQVQPGDPVPLPMQAALAAVHRSAGFDHSDCGFHHLDLPSRTPETALIATAVDALLGDAAEVAVRDSPHGPSILVQDTAEEATAAAPAWRRDAGLLDEVVITGGAGSIGMRHAEYFARHGARRIVLLGRRGADAAAIAALTEHHGTEIVAPPCDITEAEQVAAVAAEFGGGGASLLIHAAGSARFAAVDRLTADDFTSTLAAKVTGLANLTEQWPLRADARILLCSSVSGLWGGQGHGAYSAANRLLDTMAAQLRARGTHCVAVRWGLWGAGIVDAAEVARIERSGLRPMSADAAIDASLRDHPADPVIYAADPGRLRTFLDSRRGPEQAAGQPNPDCDAASDATGVVRTELAAVLSVADATTLDLASPLLDLGVDSLLALDLRKRLKRATGRSVPLAKLLGGITGSELVDRLAGSDNASEERVELSRD